jgi:hypothetical protein
MKMINLQILRRLYRRVARERVAVGQIFWTSQLANSRYLVMADSNRICEAGRTQAVPNQILSHLKRYQTPTPSKYTLALALIFLIIASYQSCARNPNIYRSLSHKLSTTNGFPSIINRPFYMLHKLQMIGILALSTSSHDNCMQVHKHPDL